MSCGSPEGEVDAGARRAAASTRSRPREALALWRGAPLADVADEPFAAAEIRRLEELRLRAAELAIDGDLAAGRHRELIGELDALVAAHPLPERLHAQRMLALYRSGRQAEALAAYRAGARVLVDEIGVEPGAELQRLHDAILAHDPRARPARAGRAASRGAASAAADSRARCWSAPRRLVLAGVLAFGVIRVARARRPPRHRRERGRADRPRAAAGSRRSTRSGAARARSPRAAGRCGSPTRRDGTVSRIERGRARS